MPSVLIVEDNELILASTEHLLRKEGFDIASANNGRDASDYLDRIHFDVVVTDIIMPYVDGRQLIRHIKKDPAKKHTGIIVVSSKNDEEAIVESLALGADEYLTKPIKPFDLVLRIKRLVEQKAADQQAEND